MKLTTYHDERGNILAVIARPDDAPPAYIELGRPDLRMTEVESSDITSDLDSEQLHERLAALVSSQRIESGTPTARLAPRG